VDNLLDSSRLSTGAVEPIIRPVATTRSWAGAGRDRRPNLVEIDVDEGLPDVLADAGLLERVVANVVDNALRHGGPVVAVRASAHAGHVEAAVVDHGPGLPKAARHDVRAVPAPGRPDRHHGHRTGCRGEGLHRGHGPHDPRRGHPGGGLTVAISLPAAGQAPNLVAARPERPDDHYLRCIWLSCAGSWNPCVRPRHLVTEPAWAITSTLGGRLSLDCSADGRDDRARDVTGSQGEFPVWTYTMDG